MFSGESVPVEVSPGSAVAGATINAGGRLVVRATRVGTDTALAHMARLVRDAQNGKASVQRLADRVSAVFVPTVMALAVLTFFGWVASSHPVRAAFTAAVAVLIVACPCALGLATPTALLVGTGRGAQLGLLIRGPEILESTRRVDAIVLDKTGTITTGRMTVTSVAPEPGSTREQVLRDAAAVEAASEHPIGRAIVAAATAGPALPLPSVTDFAAHAGAGVTGIVDGRSVSVARYSGAIRGPDDGERNTVPAGPPSDALLPTGGAPAVEARTIVGVTVDGAFIGSIALADTPKPTSREAIAAMRSSGLHTVLLSGDNYEVSRAIGNMVGVDEVIAEASPADKVATIRRLQQQGRVVAMVGDGVNDAAALAAADVGIAIGGGTDAAMAAADLTVTRGDLRDVLTALGLARRTLRTIKTNLFWAFAYNVAALPLAVTGRLNPAIAGAAMAASSVLVVSNSLRLKRFKA